VTNNKFTASNEYKEKEREAKAIRKDIATACGIISEGILRYKKKRLHARSKKQAEDLSVFDDLKDYESKKEIQDAYGWEFISEAEMDRLTAMWDAREQCIDAQGKFSDRVTEMLEQALRSCGEEYYDKLAAFDGMKKRRDTDIARIEHENRDNDYQRHINGL